MNRIGPWLALSVIALVALLGLILVIRRLISLIQTQNRMIQSLSNLTASKDLSAYVALETTNNSVQSSPTEFAPLDDQSVALRMAQDYSDHGFDPSHAYAHEDDPLADFGGTEAFR